MSPGLQVAAFPNLYDDLGGCEIPTQGYGGHADPEQSSDVRLVPIKNLLLDFT